jgi:hypothetical protein
MVKGLKAITDKECVERCLASRTAPLDGYILACDQLCKDVGSCNGCRGFRSTCQHYLRYKALSAAELCTQTYADLGCPGRW